MNTASPIRPRTERRTIYFTDYAGRRMRVDAEFRITVMIDGSGAMRITYRLMPETLKEIKS